MKDDSWTKSIQKAINVAWNQKTVAEDLLVLSWCGKGMQMNRDCLLRSPCMLSHHGHGGVIQCNTPTFVLNHHIKAEKLHVPLFVWQNGPWLSNTWPTKNTCINVRCCSGIACNLSWSAVSWSSVWSYYGQAFSGSSWFPTQCLLFFLLVCANKYLDTFLQSCLVILRCGKWILNKSLNTMEAFQLHGHQKCQIEMGYNLGQRNEQQWITGQNETQVARLSKWMIQKS